MLWAILLFISVCRSNIIRLLFHSRYTMNCDTLRYSGILAYIWIWSGQASVSIIFSFFCLRNFLSISPYPFSTYNIFFVLCFGAKTIWYWHLFIKCAVFFIVKNPPCISGNAPSNTYHYTRRLSFAKVFIALVELEIYFHALKDSKKIMPVREINLQRA